MAANGCGSCATANQNRKYRPPWAGGSQMKIGTPFGSESSGREWPHRPPAAAPPQHARVHRLQGPRGYGFGFSPTIARNRASLSSGSSSSKPCDMSLPTSSDNLGSRAFKTSSNSHCGSLSSGFGLEPNSFRRSAIRSQIRFDAAVIGRSSWDLSDYRPKSSKQPKQREAPG